ncbi:MAG TPA: glycoside hydrolase family 2 TIM barrel-domain containing protein, partial [Phycisphaerae bacterium]|nr:glycoside hydrolase family 2 TIM barrel-domain containing protein [Phycisphaerae bacterium]
MNIPRPEHPRPQFQRRDWVNLNGKWTFEFDLGRSGMAAGKGFGREITVPFCPESRLSGVGHTDFIDAMWYHRKIDIPADWKGRDVLLHFGAVDYESEVFIDGKAVGRHFGGTVSFSHDITALAAPGKTHDLVVRVADDTRFGNQPRGKQCGELKSVGCLYTRTTGIWQTVWMEAAAPHGLSDVHIVPDLDGSRFIVTPSFRRLRRGLSFRATLKDGDVVVARAEAPAAQAGAVILPVKNPRPWCTADPHLYDLTLEVLESGKVIDRVSSYAGLRKVHIEGNRICLNNKPLYLRLVLDQGFYPDGIWTAPSDEALRGDIELSMKAGFNGARLHQKVFEERFHYWADRLGYLTWGESSSWGADPNNPLAARNFLAEWREIVHRDRNHPSIIAWTPFNETAHVADAAQHARTHIDAYNICKALDPTRPVNDSSGYVHWRTDLWTVHNYDQDPAKLKGTLTPTKEKGVWRNIPKWDAEYAGQPYVVDEYGGIKWNPGDFDTS